MKKIKIFKKQFNILKEVDKKNFLLRFVFFLIGITISTTVYNTFLVPNTIVVGGMSGLAIVINALTGLSTSTFITISTLTLIILSYFTLGKDNLPYTIIGSICYTIMVRLTEPIGLQLQGYITSDFIMIITCGILNGLSSGLIYRAGFNTGGSDVLIALINKIFKIPIGQSTSILNTTIILTGTYLFGITKTIYAIFILTISSKIIDIVMLGINDNKMIYIKSHKWKEMEKYITDDLKLGVTEIGNKGGIFVSKEPTLLVILPYDKYYNFKYQITNYDPQAFLTVHDCYAIDGGHTKKILPF